MGLCCAWILLEPIVAMLPAGVARADEIAIDWRIGLWTGVVSVLAGLASGLVSALSSSNQNLSELSNQGIRRASLGRMRGSRVQGVLTVVEVALGMILCVAAGLLIRTFTAYRAIDSGIDPKNVVAIHLPVDRSARILRQHPARQLARYMRLLETVSAVPGVAVACVASDAPLVMRAAGYALRLSIGRELNREAMLRAEQVVVTPGYFETVGLSLLAGRAFTPADNMHGQAVVIISEQTAREFWPDEDPLGKTIVSQREGEAVVHVVVGVVEDVKKPEGRLGIPYDGSLYFPLFARLSGLPRQNQFLIVRTTADPSPIIQSLRQAVWSVDSTQAVAAVDVLEDVASVVTSKPANGGHRKSGQWGWPGTVLFYPFEPVPGKPVLVRQLRGPHLRT